MQKAEEYRREAEKCRDMAARETNPGAKASLLELAQKYEALAARNDQFRELQEEIRATKERDAE
jgi:hypothetical protein